MKIKILLLSIVFTVSAGSMYGQKRTAVEETMEEIKKIYSISFIYDSSLKLDKVYSEEKPSMVNLENSLDMLFNNTGIKWEIKGDYVILKRVPSYTLSGYIYQENGETVINGTVWDITSNTGTLTNEHGFYSLTLSEGNHKIRFSHIGVGEHIESLSLKGNKSQNIYLKSNYKLDEVVVTADLNSPLYTTQTGKVTLTSKDFVCGNNFMSSPDVMKKLQNLSGVANGTELISGLYVHGGGNDENLFLLDGTPLYQINHAGGLFSAFNTDIVKNIDFYKSGFPARYGGRLSSVVDVRTDDGNMKEYHGSLTLGLLEGRIQLEGPIVKDHTAFNVAIRRTWMDLLTAPACAIMNSRRTDKQNFRYAFHDINAKITHIFSDKSRADISLYSGNDLFKVDNKSYTFASELSNLTKFNLQWGNITASANWKYIFSHKLFANITGVYTHNRTMFYYHSEERLGYIEGLEGEIIKIKTNHSTIHDFGYRMEFDYRPNTWNHIRFGSNYMRHIFKPQDYLSKFDNVTQSESTNTITSKYKSNEFTVYAEDDIRINRNIKLNGGLHYTMFSIGGTMYHSIEPRAAINLRLCDKASFKASYTEMSQFMHLLSATYLNLPTDYWVPSTERISPMRARQYAAGIYTKLPYGINFSIEGFYKTMNNLIEYDCSDGTLSPTAEQWENKVRTGKGKAYGMEADISFRKAQTSVEVSYTLSWNRRLFPDFHYTWYPDKFDNRHKLSINLSHKFNDRIDAYASWNYHSGNRITIPTQQTEAPVIPGTEQPNGYMMIYEAPNNISLPAYHRLDLGINFHKITKRGLDRIWNISIYNAYCRKNPLYATVEQKPDGTFIGKGHGIFPIIPSFSYTIKF
ncbi:TonB-dependent receptor domain-containing protein [Phocaeicola faecicola]|jgi:hypothetical protein|uniref:TonB-dependent receptor domain-containing protein n=1 Tax=Phocaeicola faecicola TaxID=2739389 RepID=UPI001FE8ADD5|nr:TonB-dependent receptor [Phocaeicola faecicola]